jgi:hypothetical protein
MILGGCAATYPWYPTLEHAKATSHPVETSTFQSIVNGQLQGPSSLTEHAEANPRRRVAQSPVPLTKGPGQTANHCKRPTPEAANELQQYVSSADTSVPPPSCIDFREATHSCESENLNLHSRGHSSKALEINSAIPTLPLTTSHVTADDNMSSSTASGGVMDGVVSLDAYLAAHEPPALLTTPKASRAKAPASAPALRAVGARSSQYTIKLHEKYQALGIPKPDFHFVGDEQGWGGKVVFRGLLGEGEGGGDLVFEEKVAFGSKQEAKEKLSEVALGEVEKLEREGKLGNNRKGQKAKEERATKVDTEREPVVNYVGQLLGMHILFSSTTYLQTTDDPFQLGKRVNHML